jgi:hypothetical protein
MPLQVEPASCVVSLHLCESINGARNEWLGLITSDNKVGLSATSASLCVVRLGTTYRNRSVPHSLLYVPFLPRLVLPLFKKKKFFQPNIRRGYYADRGQQIFVFLTCKNSSLALNLHSNKDRTPPQAQWRETAGILASVANGSKIRAAINTKRQCRHETVNFPSTKSAFSYYMG